MMEDVELWWDDRSGWNFLVPAKVPDSALREMMKYAIPHYVNMWQSSPTKEKKLKLEMMIKRLQNGQVNQVLMKGGDRYEKENEKEGKKEGLLV